MSVSNYSVERSQDQLIESEKNIVISERGCKVVATGQVNPLRLCQYLLRTAVVDYLVRKHSPTIRGHAVCSILSMRPTIGAGRW